MGQTDCGLLIDTGVGKDKCCRLQVLSGRSVAGAVIVRANLS
jgi:hypothetical protein